jgi:hypothetical protein
LEVQSWPDDELRQLIEELEEAAYSGQTAELSPGLARVLVAVVQAQRGVEAEFDANSALRFQIVLGNDDGEGLATVFGAASDRSCARNPGGGGETQP